VRSSVSDPEGLRFVLAIQWPSEPTSSAHREGCMVNIHERMPNQLE
jgi:hypothetical protein